MLAAAFCFAILSPQEPEPAEVRGVWIPNSYSTFFDSRQNVRDQMALLAQAGVNVVFPVAWSKGYTLFDSAVAEAVVGRRSDPRYGDRDPLAEVLFEAHRHGIEVIPWFEYGFAAGHEKYPGKALETHPEWAAIGLDGKPVVKNGFPWMNSLAKEPQDFLTALLVDCASRYDLDGVQGDDRLPALPAEAGYDEATVARYRQQFGMAPPQDIHDAAWTQWRADLLTDYLADLRAAVKAVSPDLAFSMAPGAPSWALRDYLQDQRTWVERGLVDALHPQLYARDQKGYERMAEETLAIEWLSRRRDLVSPGVLSSFRDYFISQEVAEASIRANRERGFAGEVWFYEQGLVREDGALAKGLREGPYRRAARLPWRQQADWRPKALQAAAQPAGPGDQGEVEWTATAAVAGLYRVYGEMAEAPDAWRELASVRLAAGETGSLLRTKAGACRSVLGLIDRRADRR